MSANAVAAKAAAAIREFGWTDGDFGTVNIVSGVPSCMCLVGGIAYVVHGDPAYYANLADGSAVEDDFADDEGLALVREIAYGQGYAGADIDIALARVFGFNDEIVHDPDIEEYEDAHTRQRDTVLDLLDSYAGAAA